MTLVILILLIVIVIILLVVLGKVFGGKLAEALSKFVKFKALADLIDRLFGKSCYYQEYKAFIKTLGWFRRIKLLFARKSLVLSLAKQVSISNDQQRISHMYQSDETGLGVYIIGLRVQISVNVAKAYELEQTEWTKFLYRLFKGRVGTVSIQGTTTQLKSEKSFGQLNHVLLKIRHYTKAPLKYQLGIIPEYPEFLQQLKACHYYQKQYFCRPDQHWASVTLALFEDSVATKNESDCSTQQQIDFAIVIKAIHAVNETIRKLSIDKTLRAKYIGFSILNVAKPINAYKKVTWHNVTRYRRFKSYLRHIIIFGASFLFINAAISIHDYITRQAAAAVISSASPNTANDFDGDLTQIHSALLIQSRLYPSQRIKDVVYDVWNNAIYQEYLSPIAIASHPDTIEKLALLYVYGYPTKLRFFFVDYYLLSNITGIPQHILSIWSQVGNRGNTSTFTHFISQQSFNPTYAVEDVYKTVISVNESLSAMTSSFHLSSSLNEQIQSLQPKINATLFINTLISSKKVLNSKAVHQLEAYILPQKQLSALENFLYDNRVMQSLVISPKNNLSLFNLNEKLDVLLMYKQHDLSPDFLSKLIKVFHAQLANEIIRLQNNASQQKKPTQRSQLSLEKRETTYTQKYYTEVIYPLCQENITKSKALSSLGLDTSILYIVNTNLLNAYITRYMDFYIKKIESTLQTNDKTLDELINSIRVLSLDMNFSKTLQEVNVQAITPPTIGLTSYFKIQQSRFAGLKQLADQPQSYLDALQSVYSELKELQQDPGSLVARYAEEKTAMAQLQRALEPFNLPSKLNDLFLTPGTTAKQYVLHALNDYVNHVYSKQLLPIVRHLDNYFPFNRESDEIISLVNLANLIGRNSEYWDTYNTLIAPLIHQYPNQVVLNNSNRSVSQRISQIRNLLWNNKWEPKEIIFRFTTVLHHKESDTLGMLFVNDKMIYDAKIKSITAILPIKWWQANQLGKVSIILANKKERVLYQKEGPWAIWELLKVANREGNIYRWSADNGAVSVQFQLINPIANSLNIYTDLNLDEKPDDA